MFNEAGQPANLQGRATSAVIEVIVDHSEGSLAFRINDGPVLEALRGFPKGAPLRPWVLMWLQGDSMTLCRPYTQLL